MGHLITTNASIKVSVKDLSPNQKKFNRLTKSLQRDKELLKTWFKTHDTLRMTYTQSILPLLQEMDKLRLEALIQLDQWYNHKSLTKRQNEKLYDFIKNLAEECVGCDDSGQAEAIYNRYNEMSFNEIKKEHYAQMQSEIEDMLGVDLGEDFDFESDTAFSDFMGAVKDKAEQEKSKIQKRPKKTQTAKQKKQAECELSESQSIKDVFRQLTKVLHPDREMDETERVRKSELMQRANISYKKQDLLSLLELQFEIEQANQAMLDNLSNERLEAYNRLLQRQHQKIKEEIALIKQKISIELDIPCFYNQPVQAQYLLERQQYELENQNKRLHQDLKTLADIKGLKQWLNSLKKQTIQHSDVITLEDILNDFF